MPRRVFWGLAACRVSRGSVGRSCRFQGLFESECAGLSGLGGLAGFLGALWVEVVAFRVFSMSRLLGSDPSRLLLARSL